MNNFTFSNYLLTACNTSRVLLKGLLLFTAMVLFHFTQVQAQVNDGAVQVKDPIQAGYTMSYGDGPVDPNNPEASSPKRLSSDWASRDAVLPIENPDLSDNLDCTNLRVTLLLDESGSILNRNGVEQVREATLGFAEVFLGSNAQLTVIEFGSQAFEVDLGTGSGIVTADYLVNLEAYLYGEFDGQSYNPNSIGINNPCFGLYTNWEDALQTTIESDPNLLIFLTDGEPSAYNVDPLNPDDLANDPNNCGFVSGGGQPTFEEGLARAIPQANELKLNGTHIFGLGVGNGVQVGNLQMVSGEDFYGENGDIFTDDYSVGSFESLRDDLAAGLNEICGTQLALTKSVDIDQVCNDQEVVTFTLTVTNAGDVDAPDAINVVITDELADVFTNVVAGPGAVIDPVTGDFSFDAGNLAPGSSASATFQATLSGAIGTYTNIATANAANANAVEAEESVDITDVITNTDVVTACESYTWAVNQTEYFSTQTVEIEGVNGAGCPTLDVLELTINNQPEPIVQNVEACDSYLWDVTGETLTASGPYQGVIPGVDGQCDTPVTLNLTINEDQSVVEYITSCDIPYELNFEEYFSSETIILEFIPGADGQCDFTSSLVLSLGQPDQNDPCDDGDPNTFNDVIVSDGNGGCACEGVLQEFDCPDAQQNVGDACDDGDDTTENDTRQEDCSCAGTPIVVDPCDLGFGELTPTELTFNGATVTMANFAPSGGVAPFTVQFATSGAFVGNFFTSNPTSGVDPSDPSTWPQFNANSGNVNPQFLNNFINNQNIVTYFIGITDANGCSIGDGIYTLIINPAIVVDPCAAAGGDSDGDGVCDDADNCPDTANPDQADNDLDGSGDVCDDDDDNDGTSDDDEIACGSDPLNDASTCEVCDGVDNNLDGSIDEGLTDTDGDGTCDAIDNCPNDPNKTEPGDCGCGVVDVADGTTCQTEFGQAGNIVNCNCVADNEPNEGDCENFRYFLADNVDGGTNIYEVSLNGDDNTAVLSILKSIDYPVHIAYSEIDGLLYVVRSANGSFRTLDVSVFDGDLSDEIALDQPRAQSVAVAMGEDGKLLIGSQAENKVYLVNTTTGATSLFGSAPVSGGDIAIGVDGHKYLATRSQGRLYSLDLDMTIDDGISNVVTGLAAMPTGNLLYSANGSSQLTGVDPTDMNNDFAYNLILDGGTFTHANGDLASGCAPSIPNEGDCADFSTFYASHGPGISGTDLYRVEFSGTTATLTFLTNVNFEAHIAYNAELDLVYLVNANGSSITAYDPTADSFEGNLSIGPGINNLYAIVYDPADRLLYVGDANDDEIYTVDLGDGSVTYYANGPVNGGDLALQDGKLILATRSGNKLFEVVEGGDAVELGSIPSSVNGMARANNSSSLISSHTGQSQFFELSAANGSQSNAYDAILGGESFTFVNGDMAADCGDSDDVSFGCVGFEVLDFSQGQQTNGMDVPEGRSNPENALGDPDKSNAAGGFVSLGDGGSITIGFGGNVINGAGADIRIFETSFSGDNCSGPNDESAEIELSQDGVTWISAGIICRDGEVDMDPLGLDFVSSIRITSVPGSSLDGYDVDGVEAVYGCNNNPLESCEDSPGECYATSAVYVQGVTTTANGNGVISGDRSNPNNALGQPEGIDDLVFTSLGEGGSLTFQFGGSVPNGPDEDITVIETTFGNPGCDLFPEFANVSVSVDGVTYYHIGIVCKSQNSVDISDAVDINGAQVQLDCVNYVRVANNDELTTQLGDGFDVDGIIAIHNCENQDQPIVVEAPLHLSQDVVELTSYPNPTAGASQAVFTTMQTVRTTLEVYDMNGRSIATLFSGIANAGQQYRFDFDGAGLPNGVYVYRLTTETETIIEKFMIAK